MSWREALSLLSLCSAWGASQLCWVLFCDCYWRGGSVRWGRAVNGPLHPPRQSPSFTQVLGSQLTVFLSWRRGGRAGWGYLPFSLGTGLRSSQGTCLGTFFWFSLHLSNHCLSGCPSACNWCSGFLSWLVVSLPSLPKQQQSLWSFTASHVLLDSLGLCFYPWASDVSAASLALPPLILFILWSPTRKLATFHPHWHKQEVQRLSRVPSSGV